MLHRVFFGALVLLGLGQVAQASTINGSVTFVPIGGISVAGENAGGLGSITSVTFPSTFIVNGPAGTGGSGDYSSVLNATAVTLSPLTVPISNVNGGGFLDSVPVVTFGVAGRFVFTPTVAQISSTAPDLVTGASSLSFAATGNVVDTLSIFSPTMTAFSFSLTQPSLTGPVNASFTLTSPATAIPVGTPEPATFALAAFGVLGTLVVARRRNKVVA